MRVNGYALMGGIEVRGAGKRERKRHAADGGAQGPAAFRSPGPTAEVPPRRKTWLGRMVGIGLVAALALGPVRAAVTADTVAVFGLFGGTDCEIVCEADRGGTEVVVDALAIFGGVSGNDGVERDD